MNKISELYRRLLEQPKEIRNLVSIYWFYKFILGLGETFVYIMIYDVTKDLITLTTLWVARGIGFGTANLGYGFAAAKFSLDLKRANLGYIILLLVSFLTLYLSDYETLPMYFALFAFGAANGVFWISQHNYIFALVGKGNRDIYSSLLGVGNEINTLAVPAVAVAGFWISEHVLGLPTYDMLLLTLLAATTAMLFNAKEMPSLVPEVPALGDFRSHMKGERHSKNLILYNMARGANSPIWFLFASYIALEALETPINIGIVEFITSAITLYVAVWISSAKHSKSRMKLMKAAIALFISSFAILALSGISATGYVAFTLISILAWPLFTTPQTLMDIKTMDLMKVDGSHHLGIMFREQLLLASKLPMAVAAIALFAYSRDAALNVLILGTVNALMLITQYKAAKAMHEEEAQP